jgi:hypothetical protein
LHLNMKKSFVSASDFSDFLDSKKNDKDVCR